ncbi:MAG: 4Fe-4S binding protein, partial [Candidatus Eisenbacteria bacterium]|nr:4Fe-4S binding protein [Candidatus Eisenbacteria bacterium]
MIRHIQKKWTYLPYAVLAAVVVMSALTLAPTYCEWLCPFKTVTEFNEVNSFKSAVQAVILVSLFVGLVVVLPILTRRRTQCGL